MPLARFLPALLLISGAVVADDRVPPVMTDETLRLALPDGARIEARLDADLDGDGLADVVVVARNDTDRVLKAFAAYVSETDNGFDPVGEMRMSYAPLAKTTLRLLHGVVVVTDIDAAATSIDATWRFRFERQRDGSGRMRLIGDDVRVHSRTGAHDSTTVSTNRLTGERIVQAATPGPKGDVKQPAKTSKVSSKPLYMEDAPTPGQTLEAVR
ncbi:MAG: hypothetical protein ACTHOH_13010 [Lysobacteraceae bacterium]